MIHPVSAEDIISAHERIKDAVHRTPILTNTAINEIAGCQLFFKCENFQKIGAFKARGAANAVNALSTELRQKGVVTHSSGNHGQALALAAKLAGVPATIVMPSNSPNIKVKAVRGYGAKVILCEPTQVAREQTCADEMALTGATLIPPYDDYAVIAGQATCAKELMEDQLGLEFIIAPVGGGGLLSGTALAAHYFGTGVKVIGAEPALANDTHRSFRSGVYQPQFNGDTIADGVRVGVGQLTFPIIKDLCEDVLTATEEEIISAMRLIWERMKIIIETSCALPLAVVLAHPALFKDKQVGLILTGGNVDLDNLPF